MPQLSDRHLPSGALFLVGRGVLVFGWLASLWWLSGPFLGGPPWHVLLALVVAGLPLCLAFQYQFVVNRTLALHRYQRTGWLFRLLSGRLLGLLVALVAGGGGALLLLVNLHVLEPWEWWALLFFVPVFMLVRGLLENWLRYEYKPFLVHAPSQSWARLAAPSVVAVLFVCYGHPLLAFHVDPMPSRVLLDAARMRVDDLGGSAALRLLGQYVMLGQGMQDWGMAFSRNPLVWRILAGLDLWLLLYLVCAVFGLLLLPSREWRRLLVPLTDAPEAAAPRAGQVALFGGVLTFVVLFLVVPLLAWAELWVRSQPAVRDGPDQVVLHLERIGDAWYRPGTLATLQLARREALDLNVAAANALDAQLDIAFATMEGRIDDYLDWYYSLGGEYLRLGHLLAGDLDRYMETRLRETLQEGDLLAPVQDAFDAAMTTQARARARYEATAGTILDANRVDPGSWPTHPLLTTELDTLLHAPVHHDLLRFESCVLASGGGAAVAGAMSAAIAGKLASKMAAKTGFKLATKSFGKLAASKVAGSTMGAGTGAATGATLGSVVPGLGTAVGAVIGGMLGGIATGLAIDKALIEVEEKFSREDFRRELVEELHRGREEFRLAAAPR